MSRFSPDMSNYRSPYDHLAQHFAGEIGAGARRARKEAALYQFPSTRFVTNSPWRQWWHLLSEVLEIGRALLFGNLQHAAAETWDAKHSAETLHHVLAGKGADVVAARAAVVDNNTARCYYRP